MTTNFKGSFAELIQDFIEFKRSMGFKYVREVEGWRTPSEFFAVTIILRLLFQYVLIDLPIQNTNGEAIMSKVDNSISNWVQNFKSPLTDVTSECTFKL